MVKNEECTVTVKTAADQFDLFDHIFKQGNAFLVITGNKTAEQDKNNKISPK